MSEDKPTPLVPKGSGLFLRDQTARDIRQLCDTLRECPRCAGVGTTQELKETATTYSVVIETCDVCDGVGCVPPPAAHRRVA